MSRPSGGKNKGQEQAEGEAQVMFWWEGLGKWEAHVAEWEERGGVQTGVKQEMEEQHKPWCEVAMSLP